MIRRISITLAGLAVACGTLVSAVPVALADTPPPAASSTSGQGQTGQGANGQGQNGGGVQPVSGGGSANFREE